MATAGRRGVRESPYIGRKTDASSVLYQQYTSMESVLLDGGGGKATDSNVGGGGGGENGAAAAAAAPAAAGEAKKAPKRPKKRKGAGDAAEGEAPPTPAAQAPATATVASAAVSPAAVSPAAAEGNKGDGGGGGGGGGDGEQQQQQQQEAKKKRRRKRGKGGKGGEGGGGEKATPSGPGNAEEAARIREALGFSESAGGAGGDDDEEKKEKKQKKKKEKDDDSATEAAAAAAAPAAAAAAPAAPPPPPPSKTFQFGFSQLESDAVPVEREAKPEEGAAAAAAATAMTIPAGDDAFKPLRRARGGVKNQKRSEPNGDDPSSSADPLLARRVFVGGMPFRYEEAEVREYWSWCGEIESMSLLRFPDTGRFKGIAFITFADDEGYRKALECDGVMLEGVRVKVERCKVGANGGKSMSGGGSGVGGGGADAAATDGNTKPAFDAPAPKTPGYNVAYVGNVAFEATAEDVAALFNDALGGGGAPPPPSSSSAARGDDNDGGGGDNDGEGETPENGLPPPPPLPGTRPPSSEPAPVSSNTAVVTRVRLHTDKATGKSRGYAHVHFLTEEDLDRAVGECDGAVLFGRAVRVGYAQPKKT